MTTAGTRTAAARAGRPTPASSTAATAATTGRASAPPGPGARLYVASVQRALGLRRRFRPRSCPLLVAVIAYVPAIVFVGVAALVPDADRGRGRCPTYGEYYGFITAAILLFVAFVAPEVLCTDRRTGMLGLYLASPLTRDTYLAEGGRRASVLALVTIGPPLLLLIGYSLAGPGPGWPRRRCSCSLRADRRRPALVVGPLVHRPRPGGELAHRRGGPSPPPASSWRRSVSAAVVGALVDGAEMSPWLRLADLFNLPFELVRRIYGEPGAYPELRHRCPSSPTSSGAVVAMGARRAARYQRLTVTQ